MDAAVFGVPNDDLGEEMNGVVQLVPGITPGPGIAGTDRIVYRATRAADATVVYGRLYKRLLRDRYWAAQNSRIVSADAFREDRSGHFETKSETTETMIQSRFVPLSPGRLRTPT
jgi:hypothetical protein